MKKTIIEIKKLTGNSPDIVYKEYSINNTIFTIIYSKSVTNSSYINDFILRALNNKIIEEPYHYIKYKVPNNNIKEINNNEIITYLYSGFTIIIFDKNKILALENKATLTSSINKSEVEKSVKGPNDAFTENYESNIGMIRRRIKSKDLWLKEMKVGSESNTTVGLLYMNNICDINMVKKLEEQIKNIDIKYVGNSNYIIEAISNTNRFILPTTLTTQRPDYASLLLMEGRIILLVENSNEAIVLPCLFLDFFKNPEDYYEKSLNVVLSRIIRFISFFLTILTPAIYIALMAFNWESLPSNLLINFSIQRDGVPFSSVFEIIVMNTIFQILKECDLKFPGSGSSAISILGGLVLGQAAVEAGIVSPITIIVVGISAVCSLCFSSIELINSIRYWQLFLIILSALFGFAGVLIGLLIILATLVSQSSLGVDYFSPFEPFSLKKQEDAIITTKKSKFNPINIFKGDKK